MLSTLQNWNQCNSGSWSSVTWVLIIWFVAQNGNKCSNVPPEADIFGPPPSDSPQIGTYRTSSVCESYSPLFHSSTSPASSALRKMSNFCPRPKTRETLQSKIQSVNLSTRPPVTTLYVRPLFDDFWDRFTQWNWQLADCFTLFGRTFGHKIAFFFSTNVHFSLWRRTLLDSATFVRSRCAKRCFCSFGRILVPKFSRTPRDLLYLYRTSLLPELDLLYMWAGGRESFWTLFYSTAGGHNR
jgi:hypothetical protein